MRLHSAYVRFEAERTIGRHAHAHHAHALRVQCACTAHSFDKRPPPYRIHLQREVARVGTGHATSQQAWLVPVSGAGAKRLGDAACGVGREDARKSVGNCIAYSWKVLDDCRPIHRIADVQGDFTGNDARVGGWAVHF